MNTRSIQILDGPRFEAGYNPKLDTSLEASLPKHANDYSSSPDSLDFMTTDREGCRHKKLLSQAKYDTCFHCGVYVPKNGVKNYKSTNMDYAAFFPPKTIYETLTRRSYSFNEAINPGYAQVRSQNVEWMLRLAKSLDISANSAHLGVLLLDIAMFKDKALLSKIQLFVPVCLLLAAKTIELDQRIPFIPKLKKYANSSYNVDAFRKAELHVLDLVDWNSQLSSSLEITEFLMCQGVLYSTDEIEETGKSGTNTTKGSPVNENIAPTQKKSGNSDEKSSNIAKYLSPDPKDSSENSLSDTSTSGTSPQNERTPTAAQQKTKDEHSILKKQGTSLSLETRSSSTKGKIQVEKRAIAILAHFEKNYTFLIEQIIKDISFVKWEPKVVSAASIAFLRRMNNITPIWNNELEVVTNLKFSQISTCYDVISQKYSTKYQTGSYSQESTKIKLNNFGFDIPKPYSSQTPKVESTQPKFNLTIKTTNLIEVEPPKVATTTHLAEKNSSDLKPLERRSIFSNKSTVSSATINTGATYLPNNDLKWKNRLSVVSGVSGQGTANAEIPLRNPLRNQIFQSTRDMNRITQTRDFMGVHYSRSNTSGVLLGSAGLSNGTYLGPRRSELPPRDTYIKNYVSNTRLPRVQN